MSDRITEVTVICEDAHHQSFLNFYLGGRWRIRWQKCTTGAGEHWVRETWGRELSEYRRRAHRRSTALLAIVDADTRSVAEREQQLFSAVQAAPSESERVALLVPRRHIETWILALGVAVDVNELDRYDRDRRVDRKAIQRAAERLYSLSRPNAPVQDDILPSVRAGITTLRQFESKLRT